jgi:hypothetical protein
LEKCLERRDRHAIVNIDGREVGVFGEKKIDMPTRRMTMPPFHRAQ